MYYPMIQQFSKMLKNLEHILDKGAQFADAKKFDVANLLTARLAPDMFPLTRQVQIACDAAKLCAAGLTGKEAPVFEDNETTFAQLKTRIRNTVAFLETVRPQDFEGAEARRIKIPRQEGKCLMGREALIERTAPNVYFHVTAAYLILRHNGVDLGKTDYLGSLPLKDL